MWLFWVNVAVASAAGAGDRASPRCAWLLRVRRGKFGSRLLLKLAAIFALVGVVPGVLIYTVSYQFVSRSIESWFDVKVESALDAGLNLGRGTLDALVSDLAAKTRLAAERLGDERRRAVAAAGAGAAARAARRRRTSSLVGAGGQMLLSAGSTAARPDARAARRGAAAPGAQRARGQPARRPGRRQPRRPRAGARVRALALHARAPTSRSASRSASCW